MIGPSGIFLATLLLLLLSTISAQPPIRKMSVHEFHDIIHEGKQEQFQILDVREKSELALARVPGSSVVNLPMSIQNQWQRDILRKRILDLNKPTIIICKDGGQSFHAASFLTSEAHFPIVFVVEGGLHHYALEADHSFPIY